MLKLHEIIAIESDTLETSKKMLDECIVTFTKRTEHFRGEIKTLSMLDENRDYENISTSVDIVTTVEEKLEHAWKAFKRSINVTASKDMTNTSARADIIMKDKILIKNIPAIVLLSLETTLKRIRAIYNTIPTIDPSINWTSDVTAGRNIFISDIVKTNKTEKNIKVIELTKATKEHPATVKTIPQDSIIGTYDTIRKTGMITPGEKARLLNNISNLLIAVKQARQRANDQEVENLLLGDIIFEAIHL